jgi:hypothetical protein
VSDQGGADGGRGPSVHQAASVNVDLTSDPFGWPLGAGTPTTEDEWAIEYAVIVERMREEPQSWQARRWPLSALAADPLPDFKRRWVTLWLYAALPHAEGLADAPSHYILQRMDGLLSVCQTCLLSRFGRWRRPLRGSPVVPPVRVGGLAAEVVARACEVGAAAPCVPVNALPSWSVVVGGSRATCSLPGCHEGREPFLIH